MFLCATMFSFNRPAAVGLDDLVDLLHQPNGFLEGDDDALIVCDTLRGQHTAALTTRAPPVLDGPNGKAGLQFTLVAIVSAREGQKVWPDEVE